MNSRFIYDEKSSKLFAPDGTFLKKVFCPKAKQWNQLIIEDGETRWRGCSECQEKVVDLDVVDYREADSLFGSEWDRTCVHASRNSNHVIFLHDSEGLLPPRTDLTSPLVIETVRNWDDIKRGFSMGYWPDVRLVKPNLDISSKITVGQDPATGEIDASGDYRRGFQGKSAASEPRLSFGHSELEEVIPFTRYYPYHQQSPVAAYLVPKGLKGRTPVIVRDPIEDIVGWQWNQGDSQRATDVPGYVEFNRVVLEPQEVEVVRVIG